MRLLLLLALLSCESMALGLNMFSGGSFKNVANIPSAIFSGEGTARGSFSSAGLSGGNDGTNQDQEGSPFSFANLFGGNDESDSSESESEEGGMPDFEAMRKEMMERKKQHMLKAMVNATEPILALVGQVYTKSQTITEARERTELVVDLINDIDGLKRKHMGSGGRRGMHGGGGGGGGGRGGMMDRKNKKGGGGGGFFEGMTNTGGGGRGQHGGSNTEGGGPKMGEFSKMQGGMNGGGMNQRKQHGGAMNQRKQHGGAMNQRKQHGGGMNKRKQHGGGKRKNQKKNWGNMMNNKG